MARTSRGSAAAAPAMDAGALDDLDLDDMFAEDGDTLFEGLDIQLDGMGDIISDEQKEQKEQKTNRNNTKRKLAKLATGHECTDFSYCFGTNLLWISGLVIVECDEFNFQTTTRSLRAARCLCSGAAASNPSLN